LSVGELLKRFRLRFLQVGEGERSVDNVDALTTMSHSVTDQGGSIPVPAPPNWVPSQQDERPRH
jgi:hypothetical protein